MLSKDAQWYVENMDQISAFEKWIGLVKSDLPRQISNLFKDAAAAAVMDLESKEEPDGGYSVFPWGGIVGATKYTGLCAKHRTIKKGNRSLHRRLAP